MSEKSQSTSQLLCWNSKADSAKDDAYALFERSLLLKLDAGEWPSGYLLDPLDHRCKRRILQNVLVRPLGLTTGDNAQAKVSAHNARVETRNASRKSARDFNKRLTAKYVSGLAILNGMFQGNCIAASVLTDAVDSKKREAWNFYSALAALEKAFKPNTTVDALKFREQISELSDKGMKHSEWHSKWHQIYAKLYKLNARPSMAECNQIIIKNVKNPAFASLKSKLIIDAAKDYPGGDHDRMYTYMDFRDEALVIAQSSEDVDNWGLKGETAMVATDGSGGGAFTGCFRCGGEHAVRACEAKVCTKCGVKICNDDGKRTHHEARNCTSGGTPGGNAGRNRFSKGGDKGGKAGEKPKSSWGGERRRMPVLKDPSPQEVAEKAYRTLPA
jgi:pterin-4a-carbinolamine dehydratase